MDDFSINIWIYFLKEKSEILFTVFKKFKVFVEKKNVYIYYKSSEI